MNDFLNRLKTDRILQIIIVIFVFAFFLNYFLFLKPLFLPVKAPEIPCYKKTITIWWPFDDYDSRQFVSDFEKFCVKFDIVQKSILDINNELVLSLADDNFPNLIFVDNDSLVKLEKFLATPTPVAVDALVAYYNQDVLNFLGLTQPRTFTELKNFISKIRGYKEGFYPVGLGTRNVNHRSEIILSLLKPDISRQNFKQNFIQAINIYSQFSDPNNEYFSYTLDAGNDLVNFANSRLALYLGFYSDKEEILKLNPRLNYSINFSPLNTFPPEFKTYSKTYYLVPVKKGKHEVVDYFLQWFEESQLQNLLENYGFVPLLKNKEAQFLVDDKNKKVVLDSYNFFGETFSYLNKKILFDNLDDLLVSENQDELSKKVNKIINQLLK